MTHLLLQFYSLLNLIFPFYTLYSVYILMQLNQYAKFTRSSTYSVSLNTHRVIFYSILNIILLTRYTLLFLLNMLCFFYSIYTTALFLFNIHNSAIFTQYTQQRYFYSIHSAHFYLIIQPCSFYSISSASFFEITPPLILQLLSHITPFRFT